MLAVQWSIYKCHLYPVAMSTFEVTHHRLLIPIPNSYTLDVIANKKLQLLKGKIMGYYFRATWCRGRIMPPLVLYLVPCWPSHTTGNEVACFVRSLFWLIWSTCMVRAIQACRSFAAAADPSYKQLSYVMEGFPDHKAKVDPDLAPYFALRKQLSHDMG